MKIEKEHLELINSIKCQQGRAAIDGLYLSKEHHEAVVTDGHLLLARKLPEDCKFDLDQSILIPWRIAKQALGVLPPKKAKEFFEVIVTKATGKPAEGENPQYTLTVINHSLCRYDFTFLPTAGKYPDYDTFILKAAKENKVIGAFNIELLQRFTDAFVFGKESYLKLRFEDNEARSPVYAENKVNNLRGAVMPAAIL